MGEQADKRADLDLQVSLLAEHEVTRLVTLMKQIAKRLEIDESHNPELEELEKDVRPETVLDAIAHQQRRGANGDCSTVYAISAGRRAWIAFLSTLMSIGLIRCSANPARRLRGIIPKEVVRRGLHAVELNVLKPGTELIDALLRLGRRHANAFSPAVSALSR